MLLVVSGAETSAHEIASYRQVVTASELESWVELRGDDAPKTVAAQIRELVLTRVLAEEAERLAMDHEPRLQIQLARAEADVLRTALREWGREAIEVTDAAVDERYHELKRRAEKPKRWRLRNLFRRFPPEASEAERDAVWSEMEALRRRALAGEEFAELAREASDSQTRLRGGLIGNVRAGQLRPSANAAATALEPGEVSPILEEPEGLTILYCERIVPAVARPDEEIRAAARRAVAREAFEAWWNDLEDRLRSSVTPQVEWELIRQVDARDDVVAVGFLGQSLSVGVVRELLRQSGSDAGLSEVSREEISRLTERYLMRAAMEREAKLQGLWNDALRARLDWTRRRVVAKEALGRQVQQELSEPTNEDIERYYSANAETLIRPPHHHLAVIRISEGEDLRAAYRHAEEIRYGLQSGEVTFAEAARRWSQHPSAEHGGDVGWVSDRALAGLGFDLYRAVERLEVGGQSKVVRDAGALWLVELREREARRPLSFEEAREVVRRRLRAQRAAVLREERAARLLDQLEIELTQTAGSGLPPE